MSSTAEVMTDAPVTPARPAPQPLDAHASTSAPVGSTPNAPEAGRVGVRVSFVVISLVLIVSGVNSLAGEHLFPPTFDPAAVSANFLADVRAMLAIVSGLLVLNIAAQIR